MSKQQRVIAIINAYFKRQRRERQMTRQQAEEFFLSHGFTRDKWGHLRHGERRVTVSNHSVRLETRCELSTGNTWVRLRSAYLKNCRITPEGKLSGLSVHGCNAPIQKLTTEQRLQPATPAQLDSLGITRENPALCGGGCL